MGGRRRRKNAKGKNSDDGNGNGNGNGGMKVQEKKILVMCMRYENEKIEELAAMDLNTEEEGRMSYGRIESHLMDLNPSPRFRKRLHCCPPLVMFGIPTSCVFLNNINSLYVLGGLNSRFYDTDEFKLLQTNPHKFFLGGSRIRFDPSYANGNANKGEAWGHATKEMNDPDGFNFTCLDGKIYCFGIECVSPQVLDPNVGHWKTISSIPPELKSFSSSYYAISDPSKKCIYLPLSRGLLSSSSSLYSFTPSPDLSSVDGKWELIKDNFECWTEVAAVVEGVIYFHNYKFPKLIRAFDIATKKWLGVSWVSPFYDNNVDMNSTRMHFVALISLGDNVLCFAGWTTDNAYTEATLDFYKFKVKRSAAQTVSFIPLSAYSYKLPGISHVFQFLAV